MCESITGRGRERRGKGWLGAKINESPMLMMMKTRMNPEIVAMMMMMENGSLWLIHNGKAREGEK